MRAAISLRRMPSPPRMFLQPSHCLKASNTCGALCLTPRFEMRVDARADSLDHLVMRVVKTAHGSAHVIARTAPAAPGLRELPSALEHPLFSVCLLPIERHASPPYLRAHKCRTSFGDRRSRQLPSSAQASWRKRGTRTAGPRTVPLLSARTSP